MHSQMTCAGWLFIRVSASLGVFQQVSLLSYTVLFHTDGLDLTMTTDCESVGRPTSFHRLLRHSLVFLLTVYATYFRFEFRHIQPPLESSFNRLVCSRVYSLSTLNLFIVCSFILSYCRISVPGGVRTRDNSIFSSIRRYLLINNPLQI